MPGTELEIAVDFLKRKDYWEGDISIPAQVAKDLSLGNITIDERTIAFEMPGVPGDPKFKGEVSDDGQRILGGFTQGGVSATFKIERRVDRIGPAKDSLKGFDGFIKQALEDWNTPGLAIGIVLDNEVIYAEGFGLRDREQNLPVTTKTLFAIGSSTKAFTTFLMGLLVD